ASRLYKPNGFRPQYIVEVEAVEMENTIGIDLKNWGDWLRQALRKAPEREVELADIEIIREMVLGFNQAQHIRCFQAGINFHLRLGHLEITAGKANVSAPGRHSARHGGLQRRCF